MTTAYETYWEDEDQLCLFPTDSDYLAAAEEMTRFATELDVAKEIPAGLVSESNRGAWVLAWVWIPVEDVIA